MRARRSRERGTSLVETAIVMAVLLALVFGIIDFGRAMYTYAFVAQLARQGARWSMVRGSQCTLLDHCNATPSEVQSYVQNLSEGMTDPNSIVVNTTWPSCPLGRSGKAPGCVVMVNVTYPFQFLLPFMPSAHFPTLSMSSTSQVVISQ
jgi:Flp pilus assembly protein TadG